MDNLAAFLLPETDEQILNSIVDVANSVTIKLIDGNGFPKYSKDLKAGNGKYPANEHMDIVSMKALADDYDVWDVGDYERLRLHFFNRKVLVLV